MEDGKYYLISDNKITKGLYIAIHASLDEDNEIYASISLNDNNKINLYDINGRIVSLIDATDKERIELLNTISADIANYNGQIVYFENDNRTYEGEQFTILNL